MIFLSYRRDDAAGYARAVYDALAQRFGAEHVFMDVDDIGAGQAFDTVIRQAVGRAKVLVVMMGPRWRGEREGRLPRLFDADDFVRLEVAAGLAHGAKGMTVIPLLLDGTPMPAPEQLPPDLQPLLRHNALELDNSRFAADIERLAAALHERLGDGPRRRRLLPLLGVLVAGGGGAAVWWHRPRRVALGGTWSAEVTYDWPNARYSERFEFRTDGSSVSGTASFLGVPRGVLEGRLAGDSISFVTRSSVLGSTQEEIHRYRGRVGSGEIRFVMQTEGGGAHAPVEFVARPL